MTFIRNVEDFVCGHCGASVRGTGYTNHCPKCLWSKHVDVEPGDRADSCGGMMESTALEGSTPSYRIVHTCLKCGATRRVDVASQDSPESILALSGKLASK
ncbi:RNHCP domain-containing protein [Candidatus Kaiserbacteria bacterium]|nr:RNHCP domain-containing protein [Candidatus Kaiserbacteria bacterium]